MNEQEFQHFMQFLYNEYIAPRIVDVQTMDRERTVAADPNLEIGFHEYWRRASEACRLLRFISSSTYSRGSFEESTVITFNEDRLEYLEDEVLYGIRNHYRLAEASGFLDVIDSHYEDIVDGMKLDNLPKADVHVLTALGSQDSESELAGLVSQAKSRRARQVAANHQSLDRYFAALESKLEPAIHAAELAEPEAPRSNESMHDPAPKRSRRWWKGLGTIARGCALSGANIGMAAGLLVFPVEPSTQTWGALMSSIAGVGDVFNGVGELIGE